MIKNKKVKSELMRIDKDLANAVRKQKEEIKQKIQVEISLPQASKSLFEEFRQFKLNNKKIKF